MLDAKVHDSIERSVLYQVASAMARYGVRPRD